MRIGSVVGLVLLLGCICEDTALDSGTPDSAAPDSAVACDDDLFEPNDDESTATALTGTDVRAVLCPGGTVDWYSVEVGDDVGLSVQLVGPPLQSTQRLQILRVGGEMVDEGNGGAPLNVSAPPGNPERYFIVVTGCCAGRVEYTLSYTLVGP